MAEGGTRHVILYGPPAVGKLTVAQALGRLIGWGVLHNHLSNNLVLPVFPYGHPAFGPLVCEFRDRLFEAAAQARVPGLISTWVYTPGGGDEKTLARWRRRLARHGGETLTVRLSCKESTLYRRLANPSRRRLVKIIEKPLLKQQLKQFDLFAAVPGPASLDIDTDRLTPTQAARLIVRQLDLPLAAKAGRHG